MRFVGHVLVALANMALLDKFLCITGPSWSTEGYTNFGEHGFHP